jgi:hypothetical protein
MITGDVHHLMYRSDASALLADPRQMSSGLRGAVWKVPTSAFYFGRA